MEKRVEYALLMDFYGPLLTQHRRSVMALYLDEDMTFQEIAEQIGISRQGVHEAVKAAQAQLAKYEQTLGLAQRYTLIRQEVEACRRALDAGDEAGAREALNRIDRLER